MTADSLQRFAHGHTRSLLVGDLYRKEWDLISPSQATPAIPQVIFTNPDTGLVERAGLTRVNRQQAAPSNGKKVIQWCAPPGCTEVSFEVEACLPATITAQTIVIALYQVDGTTLVAKTVCPLTSRLQTFTVVGACVPGTEYRAVIHYNNTGEGTTSQGTALHGRVALVPTKVSGGTFSGPFIRIHVSGELLHDNIDSELVSRQQRFTGFARLIFRTHADEIVLEYLRSYASSIIDPVIFVNGEPWGFAALSGTNVMGHASVALPPGFKTVEVWMTHRNNSVAYPSTPAPLGATIHAVYVPDPEVQLVLPTTSARRLVLYGDSIAAGDGCAKGGLGGIISVIRRSFPGSVGCEAWGSRSLAQDVALGSPGAIDAAKRLAFVRRMVLWRPTDLVMLIGTNDYGANSWTAANFQTALGNVIDDIHAALPACRIFAITPLKRAVETANGLGDTLGAYRTAVAAVATARSAFMDAAIDGSTILSTTTTGVNNLFFDTVHPNENGCALVAETIRTNVGW
jgi:lysophospholipase L1-like esterase